MRLGVLLLSLTIMLGVETPADAQTSAAATFALKNCDDPKVPIGALPRSAGRVTFQLSKDGKPDTASLGVLSVIGLSVAGFKSAVARQLSACRFDVPKGALNGATTVRSKVSIDYYTVAIDTAGVTTDPGPLMEVEPFDLKRDTMPFAADDRRVEEHPRTLNCTFQLKAPTIIRASGATAAQAQADAQEQIRIANQQYNATNSGTLTAVVRVGVDGKPGSQIRVIRVSNPTALQALGDRMGSCRYVPARILGVAVPALMEMTIGGGNRP